MTAKPLDFEKFAKIIALADSDKPGEANAALRAVRRMLYDAGLSFRDFAEMARRPAATSAPASDLHLELQIKGLAKRLREREAEISRLNSEIATWRDLAWSNTAELENYNDKLSGEVEELKERLYDTAKQRRRNADKQAAVLHYLKNPALAHLSDREIARRTGVSPQTVCNWRKRLAGDGPQAVERTFLRGGREHRMQTANIGQRRKVSSA